MVSLTCSLAVHVRIPSARQTQTHLLQLRLRHLHLHLLLLHLLLLHLLVLHHPLQLRRRRPHRRPHRRRLQPCLAQSATRAASRTATPSAGGQMANAGAHRVTATAGAAASMCSCPAARVRETRAQHLRHHWRRARFRAQVSSSLQRQGSYTAPRPVSSGPWVSLLTRPTGEVQMAAAARLSEA